MKSSKTVKTSKTTKKLALRKFWMSLDEVDRANFLLRAQTNALYLQQIYCGHAQPSRALARAIEIASDDYVPRWYLRGDVWDRPAQIPAHINLY